MSTRTMRFVMVALEVLLSLCINAKELYITVDDVNYKIDTHEKTATVTGWKHHQQDGYNELIIPSTITYEGVIYKVTRIADAHADGTGVFEEFPYEDYHRNRRYLTSVIIGDNVEVIGGRAFSGCMHLEYLSIGSKVQEIKEGAFGRISEYSSSDGLTVNINNLATWCEAYFPGGATPLAKASHVTIKGRELRDLVIPNGVKKISNHAFEGCTVLTSITIPNSVTTIGSDAFQNCI